MVDPTTFEIVPFSQAVPNPDFRINLSPRLDYQVSATNTLSVRYQYYRQTQDNESVGAFNLASLGTNQYDAENTLQVNDTQTLSPRTINETKFQYIHEVANQAPVSTAPEVKVSNAFGNGGNSTGINDDTQNRFELQNETYMNFGKHSLKYGGRLRATTDSNSTNANFNGEYSFGKRQLPGCVPTTVDNCQITPLEAYQITVKGQAAGSVVPDDSGDGRRRELLHAGGERDGAGCDRRNVCRWRAVCAGRLEVAAECDTERRVAIRDAKQFGRSCGFCSAGGTGVGHWWQGEECFAEDGAACGIRDFLRQIYGRFDFDGAVE